MDEKRVKSAVDFLRQDKIKDISYQEKIAYLKTKLTEEELNEALKRIEDNSISKSADTPEIKITTDSRRFPVQQPPMYVKNESKPRESNKLMKAMNIGAISAASSIGISYLISKMNDKKEQEVFT